MKKYKASIIRIPVLALKVHRWNGLTRGAGVTHIILDIGLMIPSRMPLPPLAICAQSCALIVMLIILLRAFLVVGQFGKVQMGLLHHTNYKCGKSIYGQSALSAELGITIDAQVETPGHGKWWLHGKTGSDKSFCQQCMCASETPEEENSRWNMLSVKWEETIGVSIVVSPAAECVRMLSDPSQINGIKRKGMRAKQEGTALVKRNDYATYSMVDVPLIPEYKLVLEKGKFNGFRAHYNIHTDPNLGLRWAAICWVACGCASCKAQLKMP